MTHELKIRPEYFDAVRNRIKTFEVRKNDRNYQVGDWLKLREYDPTKEEYTGSELMVFVSYILKGGSFGIPDDMVIMSICLF